MKFIALSLAALAGVTIAADTVKVEVTRAVECDRKTKKGDSIAVHYRGTLASDGSEFDASYNRGQPLTFRVGQGSVIKGWDDNLLDMCIGEKRTLTIPPEFGYGDRAMGPIPPKSTLIFETELMGIEGVPKPEKIVEKAASKATSKAAEKTETASSKASESASSVADKATGGVKEAIKSKVADAAEAVKVVLADTDGDGQEHNEL